MVSFTLSTLLLNLYFELNYALLHTPHAVHRESFSVKVICSGCQAAFSIKDEKIPVGKEVRIGCPKCRSPLELRRPGEFSPEEERECVFPVDTGAGLEMGEPQLDMVQEGVSAALVCVSDASRKGHLETNLRDLGFQVFFAPTSAVAMNKLQHNHYDLVVLDETFGDEGLEGSALLRHFQLLPMHLRRKFFLCYLSSQFPSLDRFAAFRAGVDVILNLGDAQECRTFLERAIKERGAFYKVFRLELEKRGQF